MTTPYPTPTSNTAEFRFVGACEQDQIIAEALADQIEEFNNLSEDSVSYEMKCDESEVQMEWEDTTSDDLIVTLSWTGSSNYRKDIIMNVQSYMTQVIKTEGGFPIELTWSWNEGSEAKGNFVEPEQTSLVQVNLDHCADTVQCTTDGFPNFQTFCGEMMDLDISGEFLMSKWGGNRKLTACFRRPTPSEKSRYKDNKPTPSPSIKPSPSHPTGGRRSYVSQVAFKCGLYIAYASADEKYAVKFIEMKNNKYYALDDDELQDVPFTLSMNAGDERMAITCPNEGERPADNVMIEYKEVFGVTYIALDLSVDENAVFDQDTGGLCQNFPCTNMSYMDRDGNKVELPPAKYLGRAGSIEGAETWYEDSLLKIVGEATGIETLCLQEDYTDYSNSDLNMAKLLDDWDNDRNETSNNATDYKYEKQGKVDVETPEMGEAAQTSEKKDGQQPELLSTAINN